jgi:hypothetical protein
MSTARPASADHAFNAVCRFTCSTPANERVTTERSKSRLTQEVGHQPCHLVAPLARRSAVHPLKQRTDRRGELPSLKIRRTAHRAHLPLTNIVTGESCPAGEDRASFPRGDDRMTAVLGYQ